MKLTTAADRILLAPAGMDGGGLVVLVPRVEEVNHNRICHQIGTLGHVCLENLVAVCRLI